MAFSSHTDVHGLLSFPYFYLLSNNEDETNSSPSVEHERAPPITKIHSSILTFFFLCNLPVRRSDDLPQTHFLFCTCIIFSADFSRLLSLSRSRLCVRVRTYVGVYMLTFHFSVYFLFICNDMLSVLSMVRCNDIDLCLYVAVQQ